MKRSIIIAVCVACACVLVLGATFAYLTDEEGDINVFTAGNVEITLDEAAVDENGEAIDGADRVTENEYKLVPGKSYIKDPTVTVKAGSEDAYIRMMVIIHNADAYLELTGGDHSLMFPELDDDPLNEWVKNSETEDEAANTLTLEYRYGEKPSGIDDEGKEADVILPALFETIEVPGDATSEQMKALNDASSPFKVEVIGHAIQADGFENANAAWAAFESQVPVTVIDSTN